jgi:hypothetical protein
LSAGGRCSEVVVSTGLTVFTNYDMVSSRWAPLNMITDKLFPLNEASFRTMHTGGGGGGGGGVNIIPPSH